MSERAKRKKLYILNASENNLLLNLTLLKEKLKFWLVVFFFF